MKILLSSAIFLIVVVMAFFSCKKNSSDTTANGVYKLSYGDSVLYIRNTATNYLVAPVTTKTGMYTAFPKGLTIDPASGVINVSASETGLRYKITFTETGGEIHTTHLLIAGINYLDKYYNLSQNDSIAFPIYNGDPSKSIPAGNYDVGNGANQDGLAVVSANGQINLKQCVRNGLFGNTPKNDEWEEIEIRYTSNDNSGSAVNKIKIIIYYYHTINHVPQDIRNIVQAHQTMVLGTNYAPIPSSPLTEKNGISPALLGKPRPPCVIIVGS